MSFTHELKCDANPFALVWGGHKRFEVRKDDRGFRCNDFLLLREHSRVDDEGLYSGREIHCVITCIIRGYGLREGYVVLGIGDLKCWEVRSRDMFLPTQEKL